MNQQNIKCAGNNFCITKCLFSSNSKTFHYNSAVCKSCITHSGGCCSSTSAVLVIGRTDTVVGTEVDTLLATEIAVTVPLTTPATLAASEGVEVTVGKTVAVGVGVLCVGATAMGRTLALGPDLLIGVGVVVGFIVAVGGTRDIGGADVTMILVGVSATNF